MLTTMVNVIGASLVAFAAGKLHLLSDAHHSPDRVVFTVQVPDDGTYEAILPGGASQVVVNGHRDVGDPTEQHELKLRRGINTVAYLDTALTDVSQGLVVSGAMDSVGRIGGNMPFVTLEAEDALCNGEVIGPTYESYSSTPNLPTEASGRKACQLQSAGDYVEFTAPSTFNGMSVRYSIPDAPSGGGIQLPVSILIDGQPATDLVLSSAHSWYYGGYPFSNMPGQGKAHHFYDEVRAHLHSTYKSGSKVRVVMKASASVASSPCSDMEESARQDCGFFGVTQDQCEAKGCCYRPTKDPENPQHYPWCFHKFTPQPTPVPTPQPMPQPHPTPDPTPEPTPTPPPPPPAPHGTYVTIDLMDIYDIPEPYQPPQGAVSVVDHGADPSGEQDSSAAFAAALDVAESGGAVWIPQGRYRVASHIQLKEHVAIHGAGPWHSTLFGTGQKVGQGAIGLYARYGQDGGTAGVGLYDFAIIGDVRERNDGEQVNGIGGAPTSGSTIQNLWIQHTKCGLWLDGPGQDLLVTGNVVRDTTADGMNLHIGWDGVTVEQNSFRNVGDDGIALWSDKMADTNVIMRYNTVQLPILANGIVVYGGHDNTIQGNLIEDTIQQGGGIHVGNRFNAVKHSGTTNITGNVLNRCGCEDMNWRFGVGAIWFYALDGAIEGEIVVRDTVINDSPFNAIGVIGNQVHGLDFKDVTVNNVGTFVFQAQCDGDGRFENVSARGIGFHGIYGCSPFSMEDAGGNEDWLKTCDRPTSCPLDEQCPDNFKVCEHCGWPKSDRKDNISMVI